MIAGLSGSLFSHDAVEQWLRRTPVHGDASCTAPGFPRRLLHAQSQLGPTATARAVFDHVAEPLARALGFILVTVGGKGGTIDALLHAGGVAVAVMVVSPWGHSPASLWRPAVHRGLAHGLRWVFCVTGPSLVLVDAHRAYARRLAEFDLAVSLQDDQACSVIRRLLTATSLTGGGLPPLLDRIVSAGEEHRANVRMSLRAGVHEALLDFIAAFRAASRRHPDAQLLSESLIVIYRVLFLLFAEARGLVPLWHPVYRESYTLQALRRDAERGVVSPGLWEALQAVARLAHRGCKAGTLRVPPFNGRLFSPANAPLADTLPLDDRTVSRALVALTTRRGRDGVERISYADLGVEQLGAVYEHLLDFDLAAARPKAPAAVLVPTGRRKTTGSFYTPRSLTEFLVRRTLAPLVLDRSPEDILRLRVLDPAMGSGAFLVAACRYLAVAYEQALVDSGNVADPSDIDDEERAGFRRVIAQRCLFGVDVNPMAVQLGRLSLWLATLARDRPLTFLDHHLRTGNTLIGASIDDITRRLDPGSAAPRQKTRQDLPLFFEDEQLRTSLEVAVGTRLEVTATPDDTLEQVRGKEQQLAGLTRSDGPLERWKTAASLWCAAWFTPEAAARDRPTFRALLDRVLRDAGTLPSHLADPFIARARAVADEQRFFHWTLEFPEVFYDAAGVPLPDPGFDVILGNPPWDMLRLDRGGPACGKAAIGAFVRSSGQFRLQARGHTNLYQLFLERAFTLLRRGGRFGMVLPSGFATDQAATALRRHVFERSSVDTFTILDNRDRIFPIHTALKFLLLTTTNSSRTTEVPARTGVRRVESLDRVPDCGVDPEAVRIPRAVVAALGGDTLVVPELHTGDDLDIAATIAFRFPPLGSPDGWNLQFGRELNASDDSRHFTANGRGLPIVEGKHLHPFRVDLGAVTRRIPPAVASRLLPREKTFGRPRLAYRDVASASNRTTFIAAIVPAEAVTVHTVFCVKQSLAEADQWFLCGVFNSYVANYLIRMRVGMHVTAAIVSALPVPRPAPHDPRYQAIVRISRRLGDRDRDDRLVAELNAKVAGLYELEVDQFSHIVETFPLVPEAQRVACTCAFEQSRG